MKKLTKYFAQKQKILFLTDSLGAFTTAFVLFVIVPRYHQYFGMPTTIATYLSAIAVLLCVYSAACYLFVTRAFTPYIRFIGIANLLYCAVTFGLLIKYYPSLTIIGKTYFLSEIAIICALSYTELTVATNKQDN